MTIDSDPRTDHAAEALVAPGSTNPWLAGLYAPVTDELDVADLRVTGNLPAGLRGTFLRNGPNPAFAPLGRYHIFDGDGMLHGLELDGQGGAKYRNRWIRSAGFQAEADAGEALFGGLSDFRLPPAEVMEKVGGMKNTANTHVVSHAGRILALMEAAKPMEMSRELETLGEFDFAGALQGGMTAHPKIDPATGEMTFFGYSPFPPHLRVHTASVDGTLTWTTPVELPNPVMMHDFVVTATKVVIFDLPALFDLESMLKGGEGIRWMPENGARVGVLDRGAPGDTIRWIEVDPFWVFHFLNAHDVRGDDDAVIVTGCRASRLNTSFGEEALSEPVEPSLHRWRIDARAGTFTTEQLDDRPADFPRMDDRRAGLDARYGYLGRTRQWSEDEAEFDGVVKHDLHAGTSISVGYGPDSVSGEPVFTPDPSNPTEDAGWILNWVTERSTNESAMVVLDAETLTEVARVHAPRRVPFGFHGSFLPDAP